MWFNSINSSAKKGEDMSRIIFFLLAMTIIGMAFGLATGFVGAIIASVVVSLYKSVADVGHDPHYVQPSARQSSKKKVLAYPAFNPATGLPMVLDRDTDNNLYGFSQPVVHPEDV